MGCCGCGGELILLGYLGCLAHYRCRDCGLDQSRKMKGKKKRQPWEVKR